MRRPLIGIGLSWLVATVATAQEAPVIVFRSARPEQAADPSSKVAPSTLRYGLGYEDYDRIRGQVPADARVVPVREIPATIRNLGRSIPGRAVATTADYADLAPIRMARGRFLTTSDEERFENYAVLGSEVASALFAADEVDPIGRAVKLGADYYTVVGVASPRKAPPVGGPADAIPDRDVFIPLSTGKLRFGERVVPQPPARGPAEEYQLSSILIRVDAAEVPRVRDASEAILKQNHPRGGYRLVPTAPAPVVRPPGEAAKTP